MYPYFPYNKKMLEMKFLNINLVDNMGTNEAFWRILDFPIHEMHPAIQQLAVHPENRQIVSFRNETAAQVDLNPKETTQHMIQEKKRIWC